MYPNMYKIFFFCLTFLSLFSCNSRNSNLSEKQLLALFAVDKFSKPTSVLTMSEGYVPQPGVKYRQERNLIVPPMRIDILKGVDDNSLVKIC